VAAKIFKLAGKFSLTGQKKKKRKGVWKIIYIIEQRQKWTISQILIDTITTIKEKFCAP